MKVLMLNGSPHKNGTTFRALREIEKELNTNGIETEIITYGGAIRTLLVNDKNGKKLTLFWGMRILNRM